MDVHMKRDHFHCTQHLKVANTECWEMLKRTQAWGTEIRISRIWKTSVWQEPEPETPPPFLAAGLWILSTAGLLRHSPRQGSDLCLISAPRADIQMRVFKVKSRKSPFLSHGCVLMGVCAQLYKEKGNSPKLSTVDSHSRPQRAAEMEVCVVTQKKKISKASFRKVSIRVAPWLGG